MHDADSAPASFLAELVALRQQYAALAAALADQQRAERESDARFRDRIEGSIQGIVMHRNFTPLFANQAYATILGYESPHDIIKMGSLLPIFPPAERARLKGYVQERQEGRSVSGQQEHQVLRQDGTPIWLDAKIRESIWEGERALQVTIFDITERSGLKWRCGNRPRPWFWPTRNCNGVSPNASKLRQVLLHLVGNALKLTPRGQVTIRVESDPVTQQPRRLDGIDTGIGIPAERLEGIFERFQQADNSITRHYGGAGLGLTIARLLCQLLGYQLMVHSEVDKGSTFSVIFTSG